MRSFDFSHPLMLVIPSAEKSALRERLHCRPCQHFSPNQLQPVPKAIKHMAPPHAGNIPILSHLNSRCAQSRHQTVVIPTPQCRMRLLRRMKLFFDSQMNLHRAARKPAPATLRKLRRLLNLRHPEQFPIKRTGLRLSSRRHCKLHMINRDKEIRLRDVRFLHLPSQLTGQAES